jgi:hypothetical protein
LDSRCPLASVGWEIRLDSTLKNSWEFTKFEYLERSSTISSPIRRWLVVTSSEKPLPVVLALRDCSSLVSSGSVSPGDSADR